MGGSNMHVQPRDSSNPPRPKRRSRRGCLTCRHRKVKCDEGPECCANCDRLKLECVWESRVGFPAQRVQRSRKSRACDRCREKKLRCLAVEAPEGCPNCVQAGVPCVVPGERPPDAARSSLSAQSTPGPEKATLAALLDAYFGGPHRFCFYTFIQRPAYTRMLENNLVPRQLMLIVSATALRCRDGGAASPLPDRWADECRDLVVRDVFNRISTANLQALLLLQRYEWHRGAHLSSWFIAGLAFRLANALQLYQDPSEPRGAGSGPAVTLPVPVMESRRRLIWSCFVMDTIPDSGDRPLNPATDPDSIKARLPCDEDSYARGIDSNPGYLHDPLGLAPAPAPPSISAFVIRMTALRLRTLQYAIAFYPQSQSRPETKPPWDPAAGFFRLKAALDEFHAALPREFGLDDARTCADPPFLTSLYTLHVMYHAAYTDLLRAGTHERPRGDFGACRTPKTFYEACKRGRLRHSSIIANIVLMMLKGPCQQHDPFIGILCCLAIRILVVERRYEDQEIVDIFDPAVSAGLDACRQCVVKIAQWSKPIRRLLFAVSELVSQHGYNLDVSELLSSPDMNSRPGSRSGTPGLAIYGTAANIQKARQDHDLESAESATDRQHVSPASVAALAGGSSTHVSPNAPMAAPADPALGRAFLPRQDPLTPEGLRITSNWANGVYDAEPSSLNQMDWADIDLRWSYGQDANVGLSQDWSINGMPPPFL